MTRTAWFYDHLTLSFSEAQTYTGFPKHILREVLHAEQISPRDLCPAVLDRVLAIRRWRRFARGELDSDPHTVA